MAKLLHHIMCPCIPYNKKIMLTLGVGFHFFESYLAGSFNEDIFPMKGQEDSTKEEDEEEETVENALPVEDPFPRSRAGRKLRPPEWQRDYVINKVELKEENS